MSGCGSDGAECVCVCVTHWLPPNSQHENSGRKNVWPSPGPPTGVRPEQESQGSVSNSCGHRTCALEPQNGLCGLLPRAPSWPPGFARAAGQPPKGFLHSLQDSLNSNHLRFPGRIPEALLDSPDSETLLNPWVAFLSQKEILLSLSKALENI